MPISREEAAAAFNESLHALGYRAAVESKEERLDGSYFVRLFGGVDYVVTFSRDVHGGPATGYNFMKLVNGIYTFWTLAFNN